MSTYISQIGQTCYGAPSRIRTWDTRIRSPLLYPTELRAPGAGEGNRTLATSLEGWGSTTELHPQNNISSLYKSPNQLDKHILVGMSGFEPLKAKLTDLQSVPFGQLWNIPKYIILKFITLLELMIGLEPTTY